MRPYNFAALLSVLIAVGLLTHLGPIIGLGDGSEFWARVGLPPDLVFSYVLALIFLLCVYAILQIGRRKGAGSAQRTDKRTALSDIELAFTWLTDRQPALIRKHGWSRLAVVIIIFGLIFAIFTSKYAGGFVFKYPIDQLWHQGFVDYDATWRTPFLSVPANVLNHFDIRLPLNSRLLPVLGLSELFPQDLRVPVSYGLLFVGMMVLFWFIGATFGLRPVSRAIFAGLVALMATIPVGIDTIFWLFPPNFFTTQFLLATWWGEAPLLALATVVAFYWIGEHRAVINNVVVGCAFVIGCFLAVVGYPVGGFFFVPIIAIYCAVFLLTSETRTEWLWKGIIGAAVAAIMLACKVPQFFINLYGYTFGSYFFDSVRAPTEGIIHDTFMVGIRGFDLRGLLVFFVAMLTAIVMAIRGPRPLRRFSLAALACELVVVLASWVNAFSFRAPLLFAYAEVAHSPLWGSFFVLVGMAVAVAIDRRIALLPAFGWKRSAQPIQWLVAHRRMAYLCCLVGILLAYLVAAPRPMILPYPPVKTAPLHMLEQELALAPGMPFRGRVATIFAREGDVPFYVIAMQYQELLGSDFYTNLLPLGIPMLNENAHWTSPITFAFLYRFFARAGDTFIRNFFWLDRFDAKIARLMGVRMVVADTELTDGIVMYERRVGDRTLRIYRLDNVNIGQYSPTRIIRVTDAAAAIDKINAEGFDPQKDAVVEERVPLDLVPAQSVSIVAESGPRLDVRATSNGRSLVVLPFEYSHCLRLTGSTGTANARLFPVNLQQIGLLFENEARVSIDYRYGVFDSACRGADMERAKTLRLQDIVGQQRN
jgi:hypothetical protein